MKKLVIYLSIFLLFSACGGGQKQDAPKVKEDLKSKQLLQGIWLDSDVGDVVLKVQGDTIFYPDTTSMPVYFRVIADTLVLNGAKNTKYPILKQTAHLFIFANQNGEQIKLVKSEDESDDFFFEGKKVRPLNQNELIKRDTVLVYGDEKYHCYVQVNPTTFKVVKSSYNNDGVVVDNIYHDNIIHLSVFKGANKVYSSDFKKQDFKEYVPAEILQEAILSDMLFSKIDASGVHYVAVLGIGDSKISYDVNVSISFDGKLQFVVTK